MDTPFSHDVAGSRATKGTDPAPRTGVSTLRAADEASSVNGSLNVPVEAPVRGRHEGGSGDRRPARLEPPDALVIDPLLVRQDYTQRRGHVAGPGAVASNRAEYRAEQREMRAVTGLVLLIVALALVGAVVVGRAEWLWV